ncbi:MAG: hypothetical protein MUD08_15030 [Cytophagales bacterium]|jgi:hypothetical protein|nr:hypothetical protein [Cytophagales bacterium]
METTKKSFMPWLTQEEYEQGNARMLAEIKQESIETNRPIYYGRDGLVYEEWPDGSIFIEATPEVLAKLKS